MTRTTWMLKATAAVAVVAAVALGAYAIAEGQGRGAGRGFGGPPMIGGRGQMGGGRIGGPLAELRRLDLTDAQRDQVRQIMGQHRDATQPVRERAMAAHKALRDAIEADTIDEGAIRQRSAEAAAIDADLAVADAHLRQSVLQVLTPDQRQKLRELRSKMQERIENRRQNRQSRAADLRERLHDRFDARR